MAGERSEHTAPRATADQPPVEGEPAYEPRDDRISPEHEEPLDGPEPEPRVGPPE